MLVNKTKNQAQRELVAALYQPEADFKTLLIEDHATQKKREVCQEMVKNLELCMEYLNEVREFYFDEEPMKFY